MANFIDRIAFWKHTDNLSGIGKGAVAGLLVIVLLIGGLGFYWSQAPSEFDVVAAAKARAEERGYLNNSKKLAVGYTTTNTLYEMVDTLLEKPGGFITNDIMPPGVFMDNMPAWEFGVLVQARDLARALRKEFSRSQSQSTEDVNLKVAEPQFNFDNKSWALPSSESEYQKGNDELLEYLDRLANKSESNAQFYARADNLRDWLSDVSTRLGSLSQRLSASVTKVRENTDLAGDPTARQSTATGSHTYVRTPWTKIDDVFYEARGASWALIHILKAIEVDFVFTLQDKNALVSLRQIIRELESTQATVWSPMILNGSGFGMLANHSLVMASYISRANAAIIDLRRLLEQG
ncbi:DUF2333 family protein [Marinomonas mediterranea]|jgi:Uncharacterized protein conserved in bacteria|uniref:Uncharacterized conserved protein UCP029693 n=1 Tax=Marinomonas mediterranea (strain ATCC 700492 / JCM 21426 / NBRC 103028 / MMB-1) TaxID=717774 RepID=F2K2C3_MARM1|nr:DUF2333 family protein [Marinomonas mediterranea]ADZ92303.1 Uncharacterized conserved protein UCP029693 [Marinomonas mediterranea MMB-1]WCN18354.1 DUF2333 family protein [Marinomonas mediterranea MMB-1]